MNCANLRSRILAKTHPEKLPAAYKAHVQTCQACQAWHRQLVAVEQVVSAVVVPEPSPNRKANFLKQFQALPAPTSDARPAPAVPAVEKVRKAPKSTKAKSTPKVKTPSSVKTVKPTVPTPAKPRLPLSERLTRLWPAGVAAAIVLGGAIIWSMKDGGSGPTEVAASPRDPMLEKAVRIKVKLDTTKAPADKMNLLVGFSEDVYDEAKTLAKLSPGADMESLAKMFDQIVRDAVVKHARLTEIAQNKKLLLDCVDRLGRIEQDANRRSIEVPPGSDKPLRDIAASAKEGKEKLAQLALGKAL